MSSNVVSILQVGGFFGALGSAPISGELFLRPNSHRASYNVLPEIAKLGRRWTLLVFAAVFIIGAVRVRPRPIIGPWVPFPSLQILTVVADGSNGLAEIYAGRVISGIGIGGMSAVAATYISECAPKHERGRITGLFAIMVRTSVVSIVAGVLNEVSLRQQWVS